jgi:hypothetical protein
VTTRAVGAGLLDVAQDPVERGGFDQRTDDGGVIGRVTHRALLRLAGERGDELLLDRTVDEDARARAAVLPGVPERRLGQIGRHQVDLVAAVGHDDLRALPAALQHDALEVGVRGVAQEGAADLGRAGEGDHVDARVQPERFACDVAEARDDVEDAVRDACLGRLGQPQRGQRRQLRRLDHQRVAGGERRSDLPRQRHQREVPRQHTADDPDGFPHDQPEMHRRGAGWSVTFGHCDATDSAASYTSTCRSHE